MTRGRFAGSASCEEACFLLGGGGTGELDREEGGEGGSSGGRGAVRGPSISRLLSSCSRVHLGFWSLTWEDVEVDAEVGRGGIFEG